MARKSKQAGGNMPLTYYERTKKFASSEYGTIRKRMAGHSQYQLGMCGLSLTRIDHVVVTTKEVPVDENRTRVGTMTVQQSDHVEITKALCSPSGYLYSEAAIYEYLLIKTQELKTQRALYEQTVQKRQFETKQRELDEQSKRTLESFQDAQCAIKKQKTTKQVEEEKRIAIREDLKRSSYWLASSQPVLTEPSDDHIAPAPPERPASPNTEEPIRKKDLWPVHLQWEIIKGSNQQHPPVLVCALSSKSIQTQNDVMAYWTDRKEPGTVVLTSVYQQLVVDESDKGVMDGKNGSSVNNKKKSATSNNNSQTTDAETVEKPHICPLTSRKIRFTRSLQKSGSSFATSGQKVELSTYRPTIT